MDSKVVPKIYANEAKNYSSTGLELVTIAAIVIKPIYLIYVLFQNVSSSSHIKTTQSSPLF